MTLRHWAVAGLVLVMAGCGSRPAPVYTGPRLVPPLIAYPVPSHRKR